MTPIAVTGLDMAFPANVTRLMPPDIPEEFYRQGSEWDRIASAGFHPGWSPDIEFHMKDGIDGATAYRHLCCILRSYQPKQEDKIAAVAYLLSEWCARVEKWKR